MFEGLANAASCLNSFMSISFEKILILVIFGEAFNTEKKSTYTFIFFVVKRDYLK